MTRHALGAWVVAGAVAVLAAATASPARAQLFRRPVECTDCIANWFYFDDGGRDWNCLGSFYDAHRGSDFSLRGGNAAIDAGNHVVAVADGVVMVAHDGEFDHCSACSGTGCGAAFGFGYGNYLVIDHGTRTTVYAHMRTGSLRVAVGDRVTCGQHVGDIGSSGCSTGAHLHLETRPSGGDFDSAYDSFVGACSATPSPVFVDQGPWRGMPSPACEGDPPPGDAGTDAGGRDAGTDAGRDAGVRPDDAATPPDASTLPVDGGEKSDASATVVTEMVDGGCGCRAATSSRTPGAGLVIALVALTLATRRRRATRAS